MTRTVEPRPASRTASDWPIALAAGQFVLTVYLLSFSGILRSVDELGLYAVAENLARSGQWQPLLTRFAAYHNAVGAFEPGYPLLAMPFHWLAQQSPAVSNLHVVMLLNPLLTAATVSALFLLGRTLEYSRGASLVLALAYGLATMAWPYARTLLREPAVAVLWTLAFVGLARFDARPDLGSALLAFVPPVLAAGVKFSSIVAWPVVAALLGWTLYRRHLVRPAWLISIILLAAALGAAVALYWIPQRGPAALELLTSYLSNPFTAEALTPVYGVLASPGKSVFLYSPVLLLGLLGLPAFFARHRLVAAGAVLMWVSFLSTLRVSSWWGGLTWGPRFLLPLLPLGLLPAVAWFSTRRWTWGVALLSAALQAWVAVSDWTVAYPSGLFEHGHPDLTIGMDWTRWASSTLSQFVQRWSVQTLDLIWLHPGADGRLQVDGTLALALCAAVAAAALLLWRTIHGSHVRLAAYLAVPTVLLAAMVLPVRAYYDLPDYPGLPAETARVLAEGLSRDAIALDRVVNVSPDIGVHYWLGLLKGRASVVWISPAETEEEFDSLLPEDPGGCLAIVIDRPHIGTLYPSETLVEWLNVRAYRLASRWVEGYQVYYYATPAATGEVMPARISWGPGLALNSFSVAGSARPGTALLVDLMFDRQRGDWPFDSRFFVHLLGPGGVVLSGEDGPLGYGRRFRDGWGASQTIRERRGVWIPPEAPQGSYELIVGFADEHGYVPVGLSSGATADYAVLATVPVGP